MSNWQEFDDYMIYNETTKTVVTWTTYGDENNQYFLSREYEYEDDIFDDDRDTFTLINEEVTEENSVESMINRTKEMVA